MQLCDEMKDQINADIQQAQEEHGVFTALDALADSLVDFYTQGHTSPTVPNQE
jgi:hypothetical protein